MAKRDTKHKKGLIMGSQFKVMFLNDFIDVDWLVFWLTGAPFGEQVQEVVESHETVAIEIFLTTSTRTP